MDPACLGASELPPLAVVEVTSYYRLVLPPYQYLLKTKKENSKSMVKVEESSYAFGINDQPSVNIGKLTIPSNDSQLAITSDTDYRSTYISNDTSATASLLSTSPTKQSADDTQWELF